MSRQLGFKHTEETKRKISEKIKEKLKQKNIYKNYQNLQKSRGLIIQTKVIKDVNVLKNIV